MLKYLIVQLDDTSVSFCHYPNPLKESRLIDKTVLDRAVLWAMKENITIQYLYPDYELPAEYHDTINRMGHADIVRAACADAGLVAQADVVVFDLWESLKGYPFMEDRSYVIRTSLADLLANGDTLVSILPKLDRLNVAITDVEDFERESDYAKFLEDIVDPIVEEYKAGHAVQLNLLTDRILLDGMNSCNAGDENITLAPDGRFYVCPAFYLNGKDSDAVGDVENGPDIKNPQLYRLDHAPICRNCDAYQCRRCVWLNRNLTLEVNTPGREQCVMAHLERNASRKLLEQIRMIGTFAPGKEIPAIDYLDPFEIVIEKQ